MLDRRVHPGRVLRDEHQRLVPAQGQARGVRAALVHAAGCRASTVVSALAALRQRRPAARRTWAEKQPAKLAAMEAHFETGPARPVRSSGSRTRRRASCDAKVASARHDVVPDVRRRPAPVLGLDAFRPDSRPPVVIPFFAYHAMVGLGMALIGWALSVVAALLVARRALAHAWLLWVFVFAVVRRCWRTRPAGWRRRWAGSRGSCIRRWCDGRTRRATPRLVRYER